MILTHRARITEMIASPTVLRVRLGGEGAGIGNPIVAMILRLACSLVPPRQLENCTKAGIHVLDAHRSYQQEEVPLLKGQRIAESCFSRKLCFEVSNLAGQLASLSFESRFLTLQSVPAAYGSDKFQMCDLRVASMA